MKYTIILITLLLSFASFGQQTVNQDSLTIVEEPASFPGGIRAFYEFIKNEVKYPKPAKYKRIEGNVYVQFIVEEDGSLTDVKVVKGLGSGLDEEALRLMMNSPKWEPGTQKGVPVRQKMIQNILFKIKYD